MNSFQPNIGSPSNTPIGQPPLNIDTDKKPSSTKGQETKIAQNEVNKTKKSSFVGTLLNSSKLNPTKSLAMWKKDSKLPELMNTALVGHVLSKELQSEMKILQLEEREPTDQELTNKVAEQNKLEMQKLTPEEKQERAEKRETESKKGFQENINATKKLYQENADLIDLSKGFLFDDEPIVPTPSTPHSPPKSADKNPNSNITNGK